MNFTVLARQVLVRVQLAAGPQQKSDEPVHVCLMFQTLSLCMCCSSHMSLCIMLFATLILGILSVTVQVFYVPNTHRWFPLVNSLRSVNPSRCLIVYWFYSVLHCSFFPFPRIFFVGAASLMLQRQLWQFFMFFIRSLAVARFDWWLNL
jgi:hypothetical protein